MQDSILRDFRKIVTSQFISKTARQLKFNLRSTGQLSGLDFIYMLIRQAGSGLEMSYNRLNATLRTINPSINISHQALAKYFYKQASLDLIQVIYSKIFSYQKEKLLQEITGQDHLHLFNRILIQDSTICTLYDRLESYYEGSGGSASKSSVKIDLIHELKTATILKMDILEGNVSDRRLSLSILDEVQKGDLILRDLGYSLLEAFDQFTQKEAHFISRLLPNMNIYLDREDKQPIVLSQYLKKENLIVLDRMVYVGEVKQKMRLIAYKLPLEMCQERRRKAWKNAQSKGRTPSKDYLDLCDYLLLITNLPQEKVKADVIGTIYRMRWGVELIFKNWKSKLKLQSNLKGHQVTRIKCLIYIILILTLLTALVQGWLKRRKLDVVSLEISLEKLTDWLINRQGYYWLFFGSIQKFEIEIWKDLRFIKKQKRNRKTTLERVVSNEAYPGESNIVNF